MKKFDMLKYDRNVRISKKGMEIGAYIAGVNSGMYQLPFIVYVRVWSYGIFRRIFYKEMRLNIWEVKQLKEECEKVIEFYNNKKESE